MSLILIPVAFVLNLCVGEQLCAIELPLEALQGA